MSSCKSLSSPQSAGGRATNTPDTSAQSHHFVDQRALRTMIGAAAYHARRVARTMGLSDADREDVEQDIMLALLERRRFFDPARGAWSSFADRVARQAAQGAADEIGADRRVRGGSLDEGGIPVWRIVDPRADPEEEVWLPRALSQFVAELPSNLSLVAKLALQADGDLATAQRRSGLSSSQFYRRLREIRYRMVTRCLVDRSLIVP
jgi:DNA-directed RNA polymerase specialized sigma24 family protein